MVITWNTMLPRNNMLSLYQAKRSIALRSVLKYMIVNECSIRQCMLEERKENPLLCIQRALFDQRQT